MCLFERGFEGFIDGPSCVPGSYIPKAERHMINSTKDGLQPPVLMNSDGIER